MTSEKDDKGFISRWSERKVAVKEAEEAQAGLEPEAAAAIVDAEPDIAQESDGELEFIPTEEDVEKLDNDSDFSAFLKASVPQHIKRMALQKLWRTDPAFAVIDGLLEYGEDYADLHKKGAIIQSAWQAGKGYFGKDKPETSQEESAPDNLAQGEEPDPVSENDAGTGEENAEAEKAIDAEIDDALAENETEDLVEDDGDDGDAV